jgi:hypothetical protein
VGRPALGFIMTDELMLFLALAQASLLCWWNGGRVEHHELSAGWFDKVFDAPGRNFAARRA